MTYSLLLRSLDSKPTREELEEISVHVPSIAKADCRYLLDDWFGVVVSHVDSETARLFQAALKQKGYETDQVADGDIPALHGDFRCQRLSIDKESILFSDAMGRNHQRYRSDLVFAAAGAIEKNRMVSDWEVEMETRYTGDGAYTVPINKRTYNFEKKAYFRFDFFFTSSPNRLSLELAADNVIFYMDRPVRMRDSLDLKILMVDIQALLPPVRMNQSLRNLSIDSVYPSMKAYEEELRWAFYRLGAKA